MMPWLIAALIVVAVLALWPPTPRALGRLAKRMSGYARVMSHAKRNRTDVMRWLIRRPALFAIVYGYEASAMLSNGLDTRLKLLAGLKASSLTGCPF